MSNLVPPHGSLKLNSLLLSENLRSIESQRALSLPKVSMTSRETSDLLLLSMGAYTPLKGFMNKNDWHSVCVEMKLSNGTFWPIPITLSVSEQEAKKLKVGQDITLVESDTQTNMAVLTISEFFYPNIDFECEKVFKTNDKTHPGVAKVKAQKKVNLSGSVKIFNEGWFPNSFGDLYIRPAQSRRLFTELGWSKIAAFQTRNPMHRSHEHLVKIAIEILDGVFVHHSIGKLKTDDIPASVCVKASKVLIENYFVKGSIIQAGYPIEMRYAGPREALLHALIRQNFGCSHLIVGRDHAGVGNFYGSFDSQNIFDQLWYGALITQPLKIDITFYCNKCDGVATAKTCPHSEENRIHISGTRQRLMLSNDEKISTKFSRPEVIKVLRKYYKEKIN